jgi:hypothetical protein
MATAAVQSVRGFDLDITAANKLTECKKIGEGGFGEVFLAQHSVYGTVVYKRMNIGFIKDTDR